MYSDKTELLTTCIQQMLVTTYPASDAERFKFRTASAEVELFNNILHIRQHLLFRLLSPVRDDHYFLRDRSHNLQLPARSSSLKDNAYAI